MNNLNLKLIIIGIVTGLVNGIFGAGGGIIVVPSLVFLLGLEDYKAHATTISIILPITIISSLVYLINQSIPIKTSLLVILGGLFGSFLGARLLQKVPVKVLRKVFGSLIIYTAIRMIFKCS